MNQTEVEFVPAVAGWEVLYYRKTGRYDATPIVAWAVLRDSEGYLHATAVTTDLAWSFDAERYICGPDGRVSLGGIAWETIPDWIEEMVKCDAEGQIIPAASATSVPPIVLENYRRRFTEPK